MQHLDEGTIHAWLDGALDAEEGTRVEQHVATCAECAAAVAEARGLVAGASRVLSALDHGPSGVVPRAKSAAPKKRDAGSAWRILRFTPARAAAAAVLVVAAGTMLVARQGREAVLQMPASADRVLMDSAASPPPPAAPAPLRGSATSVAGSAVSAAEVRAPQRGPVIRRAAPSDKADGRDPTSRREVRDQAASAAPTAERSAAVSRVPSVARATSNLAGVGATSGRAVDARRDVQIDSLRQKRALASAPSLQEALREQRAADAAAPSAVSVTALRAEAGVRDETIAGCYAVTSDRPVDVPSRLSLDTTAAGFVAKAGAQVQSAPVSRARQSQAQGQVSQMPGQVSFRDTTSRRQQVAAGAYWTQYTPTTVRVVLDGTATRVLQLQVQAAGVLQGVVEHDGRTTPVTLRRADCR